MNRELYTRPDHYTKKSRDHGYRSRAAWKLIEIDDKYHLIKGASVILDLGCCPGSWLQVITERTKCKILGIDIQITEPVQGAIILHGDIRDPEIINILKSHRPQTIVSDMAPSTSGSGFLDHQNSLDLNYIALNLAQAVLEPGGKFLCKLFSGNDDNLFVTEMKKSFKKVLRVKPAASKSFSREIYILGLDHIA